MKRIYRENIGFHVEQHNLNKMNRADSASALQPFFKSNRVLPEFISAVAEQRIQRPLFASGSMRRMETNRPERCAYYIPESGNDFIRKACVQKDPLYR